MRRLARRHEHDAVERERLLRVEGGSLMSAVKRIERAAQDTGLRHFLLLPRRGGTRAGL